MDFLHRTMALATMLFDNAHQALFERLLQPLLFSTGLAAYMEDAYVAAAWLLAGLLQIAVMLVVIGPLERWRPVEPAPTQANARRLRRAETRVDIIYTLIDRLGLVSVLLFFATGPMWNSAFGWLAVHGVDSWDMSQWLAPWWPGVTDTALFAFASYVLVLDFFGYWLHRAQHRFGWWWALHAVHHSQRHMTMWTDNRNHLLDSLVADIVFVLVARVIGVPPAQFIALVMLTRLIENLSHANLRLGFGRLGERLLVGPRFHRVHHGIEHDDPGRGTLGGCNFAVLFPVWDLLFGTANYGAPLQPTGIRDQLPQYGSRDYGQGFWAQQWLGLKRLRDAMRRGRFARPPGASDEGTT